MIFRAEDILVHERKMGHVEKILDDAKAGRPHLDPTAGHKSTISFAGFRNIENLALGLSQRGPDATITLAKRQRRSALAVASGFCDVRQSVGVAEQLDILPEQPGADNVVAEIGAGLDRVPLIKCGFIRCLGHASHAWFRSVTLLGPLHCRADILGKKLCAASKM